MASLCAQNYTKMKKMNKKEIILINNKTSCALKLEILNLKSYIIYNRIGKPSLCIIM